MVWILLLTQVYSMSCHISCLDSCKKNPTTACIKECCPKILLLSDSSCSLECEQIEGVYECKDTCVSSDNICQSNCESFCDNRTSKCVDACLKEFCGHYHSDTNWVFVIGLILLFCVFVVVLYKHIAYINRKVSEAEFEYT